jgi:hypothetical protein
VLSSQSMITMAIALCKRLAGLTAGKRDDHCLILEYKSDSTWRTHGKPKDRKQKDTRVTR